MSARLPVPLVSLARRIPEAGRIRLGEKTGSNGRPTSLDVFRFTSNDREALDQIAALYGGTVKPWGDPKAAKGQWEVKTTTTEVAVALPPDPLGGSPVYELWGGGGCERRCDGQVCTIATKGPDGPDFADVDCLCAAKGALACKVKVRLSVILPSIRFTGTWRLETSSDNAAAELPGMVDMIQSLQTRGLTHAVLRLTQRRSTVAGETHQYVVPTLGVPVSVMQLAAGEGGVSALDSPEPEGRSLGQGDFIGQSTATDLGNFDHDVVDAELVDAVDPDDPDDIDLTLEALVACHLSTTTTATDVWRSLAHQHGDAEARRKLQGCVNGQARIRASSDEQGVWLVVKR